MLSILIELARERPQERSYVTAVPNAQLRLAADLEAAGRSREAARVIGPALAGQRALAAAEPNNANLTLPIQEMLGDGVRIAYRVGDLPLAIQRGRESLANFAHKPAEERASMRGQSDIWDTQVFLGLALQKSARADDTQRASAKLGEASSLLQEALGFAQRVRAQYPGAGDESDFQEALQGAAACGS